MKKLDVWAGLKERALALVAKFAPENDTPADVQASELLLASHAGRPDRPLKRFWEDRSKYMPHQGTREKLRRLRQMNPDWMNS
jgi:hypothetical protein